MRSAPTVKLMAVKTLHRHLEDGLFAVPRLQREFVWNGNKAARLLDSVSRVAPTVSPRDVGMAPSGRV